MASHSSSVVLCSKVYVGITREGYVKKSSIRSFRATDAPTLKENDSVLLEKEVSTLNTILIFANKGNYIYLPVYKIPEYKWKVTGKKKQVLSYKPEEQHCLHHHQ